MSARTCPLQIAPEQGFVKPESSPQAAFYYQFLHPTASQRLQRGPLRLATSASLQRALRAASRRPEGTCTACGPTAGLLGQEEAALSPLRDKASEYLHGAERQGGDPTPRGEGRGERLKLGERPRRAVTCGAEHEVQGAVPRCCHNEVEPCAMPGEGGGGAQSAAGSLYVRGAAAAPRGWERAGPGGAVMAAGRGRDGGAAVGDPSAQGRGGGLVEGEGGVGAARWRPPLGSWGGGEEKKKAGDGGGGCSLRRLPPAPCG